MLSNKEISINLSAEEMQEISDMIEAAPELFELTDRGRLLDALWDKINVGMTELCIKEEKQDDSRDI